MGETFLRSPLRTLRGRFLVSLPAGGQFLLGTPERLDRSSGESLSHAQPCPSFLASQGAQDPPGAIQTRAGRRSAPLPTPARETPAELRAKPGGGYYTGVPPSKLFSKTQMVFIRIGRNLRSSWRKIGM